MIIFDNSCNFCTLAVYHTIILYYLPVYLKPINVVVVVFRSELPNDFSSPDVKLLDVIFDAVQNESGKSRSRK